MKTNSPYRLAIPEPRALALAIGMALCAAPAVAQVDASAYISSFGYTTTSASGAPVDLLWSDPYQLLSANSLNGGGLFGGQLRTAETNSFAPAANFSSTANTFTSYASPGDQTFFLTAFASRSVGPPGTPRNQSTATGLNSGTFSLVDLDGVAQEGSVTFFVNYLLDFNKPGGNAITDFSTAFVHFNAMGDDGSGDDLDAHLFSFEQLGSTGHLAGQFAVTVTLAADEFGYYTLDGSAESFAAVVPEPQEWALLLAGLAGLGTYVRKRKAALA